MSRVLFSPYPGYRDVSPEYNHLIKPLKRKLSLVIGLAVTGFFLPVVLSLLDLIPIVAAVILAPLLGFAAALSSFYWLLLGFDKTHFSVCPECSGAYEDETHGGYRFRICHRCKIYFQGAEAASPHDEIADD